MNGADGRTLLRLLAGELSESELARLRTRLPEDAELAQMLARLESAWDGIADLPKEPGIDLRARLDERLPPSRLRRGLQQGWRRASAAAVALVLGVSIGVAAGWLASGGGELLPPRHGYGEYLLAPSPTLAQSYWESLAALEEENGVSTEEAP